MPQKSVITLQKLLELNGLDTSKRIKLVRHADERNNLTVETVLGQEEKILECQKHQTRAYFHNTDYIITLVGGKSIGTKAIFVGVYKVKGWQKVEKELNRDERYIYEFEELPEFQHMKWRIVVEWGPATKNWVQDFSKHPKEVVEIRPPRWYHRQPFPGYDKLFVSFEQLEIIYKHPELYWDWVSSLKEVGGIYVIYVKGHGIYIGSASGNEGIWGRWKEYVYSKHGGDKELKTLLEQEPEVYKNFHFAILKIFPKGEKKENIQFWEKLFKEKLGTRTEKWGLNKN